MSLVSMLRHTCSVSRNQALGTNGRKAMQTVHAAVPCSFMPMSAQASIQNNFEVGFGWDVYFAAGADVQIGDKLTWNGTTYLARGRQPFAGFGSVSYLKVAAVTEQSNGQ